MAIYFMLTVCIRLMCYIVGSRKIGGTRITLHIVLEFVFSN